MTTADFFDIERFVTAQAPIFDSALAELKAGRKRSHWMWFIFPQLRGLGVSSTAQFYGLGSLDEARAYLAHPTLGSRLNASTAAVLTIEGRRLSEIFGSPDDMKFRSCMTLFAYASDEADTVFHRALDRYCDGKKDERTLQLLNARTS